jgi:predicted transcriptional regulator
MGRKSTAAEKGYRVNRVARLLSNGAVRSEISQYAASEWGCSIRQADRYIAEAREILKADWDIDRRTFTAELLSQLASLQKEARKGNQPHVALGCINTAARIAQLLS